MSVKQPYIVTEKVAIVNSRVSVSYKMQNLMDDDCILNHSTVLTTIPGLDNGQAEILVVSKNIDDPEEKSFSIETDDGRIGTYKGRYGVIQYLTNSAKDSDKFFKVVTESFTVSEDEMILAYVAENINGQSPLLNYGFGQLFCQLDRLTVYGNVSLELTNFRDEDGEVKSKLRLNLSEEDLNEFIENGLSVNVQYTTLVDKATQEDFVLMFTEKCVINDDNTIELSCAPYRENDLLQPFLNFGNTLIVNDTFEGHFNLTIDDIDLYKVHLNDPSITGEVWIQYLTLVSKDTEFETDDLEDILEVELETEVLENA